MLAALAPQSSAKALTDLDEIAELGGPAGRLIVDVDHIGIEDIGWVRRILALRPGWAVVCTGRDAGARNARALLALEHARWLTWPPTLDELRWLAAPPPPRAVPPAPVVRTASELAAPGLGREHVAVLADISQRLELAFAALREGAQLSDAQTESPSIELRRLMRFTRTLSCLISPPPRGDEEFDLAALIEEQLAALTLRARKGPRFQPKAGAEGRPVQFPVRADRAALALAFEALLQLARHCAGQGETVRVLYTPLGASELQVGIEFPAGPLAGLSTEQLADSALLRERLPELWPSDLTAASAILGSQGGGLAITANGNGNVALLARVPALRLPATAPAAAAPAARAPASARGSGNDPFA